MSLEAELNALNVNLAKLVAVLDARTANTATVSGPQPYAPAPKKESKAKAAVKAVEAKVEAVEHAVEAEAEKVKESVITHEQVATQLIATVKTKGRDAAVDVLKSFGFGKISDAPAEKLHELHAALVKAGE